MGRFGWLAMAGLAILGALSLSGGFRAPPVPEAERALLPKAEPTPRPIPAFTWPQDEVPGQEVETSSQALLTHSRDVQAACGLPLTPHCAGGRCVAVLVAPDLDRFSGWVRMVGASPRFVLSTALRDLGLPSTALPCGLAVGGLAEGAEIASVALPDGRQVWCSAPAEAGWDADIRGMCAQAAGVHGLQPDFEAPDLRLLRFDPG